MVTKAKRKPTKKTAAKAKPEKVTRKPRTSKKQVEQEHPNDLLDIDHLALYSSQCKRCGYLDPDEPRKFKKCHFSSGNDQCPASEVRIVIVGQATSYAQQVLRAREQRKPQTEAKLMAFVSKQNAAFQSKFYSALENGE